MSTSNPSIVHNSATNQPSKVSSVAPSRARKAGLVPPSLTSHTALAQALAILPSNYNFEIHKTLHRIHQVNLSLSVCIHIYINTYMFISGLCIVMLGASLSCGFTVSRRVRACYIDYLSLLFSFLWLYIILFFSSLKKQDCCVMLL